LNTKYGDKFKVLGKSSPESYPIRIETKNGKEINMKKDYLSIKKPESVTYDRHASNSSIVSGAGTPKRKIQKCCLCLDQEAVFAAIPCGHRLTCVDCNGFVTNGSRCYICRKEFSSLLRIY